MTERDVIRAARRLAKAEVENLLAHGEISDREDGDGKMRSIFVGTVFQLTPSGKYYMPWACSNVDPCPRCKGEGTRPHKGSDPAKYAVLQEYQEVLVRHMSDTYGIYPEAPEWYRQWLDLIRSFERDVEPSRTCPLCHGHGSREAYLDEVWRDAFEDALSDMDCYAFSGEGDPCDIFIGQTIEEEAVAA